jgi:hypothetical protein
VNTGLLSARNTVNFTSKFRSLEVLFVTAVVMKAEQALEKSNNINRIGRSCLQYQEEEMIAL